MITQRQSDSINVEPKPVVKKTIVEKSVAESVMAMDGHAEEQHYRSAVYRVLAGLLRTAPDNDALGQVSAFASIEPQADELALAMSMLGVSASASNADSVDDEFHDLFIGLGRGELMPYASWYLTGFLMEKPLSSLRDELAALGFERSADVHEPEDHVAALCEVMAMMIEEGFALKQQEYFFTTHMSNWLEHFFIDLSQADAAVFYRSVGRFGQAFSTFEKHYLTMQV
jgi:TorA maturation chaperone TorD